ncbi:hypothetical protein [sulfur-oxidizing endosymbiont of Gigantopelta aegis]|uniref:hypothetical protein n=1 Tax=sulfur-oxidizing endosymbiont of Gigantopelta aegis TaxID=2794934 RepID=UPI0018DDE790|nr:hypothetical protein [sulfur-oxidizing endosymbiont of Gigantopelta aegis]
MAVRKLVKNEANDDVLVYLKDGRFACVHLVWHGHIDQQPSLYPSCEILLGLEALQKFINAT